MNLIGVIISFELLHLKAILVIFEKNHGPNIKFYLILYYIC